MPFNEDRIVLNLTAPELEDLIKKWLARLMPDYAGFEQASRSADMGRDAVGFLSMARYDGDWHNYQCKQLSKALPTEKFILELGKIFHYHCAGEFTMPTKFVFVAPKGGGGPVKKMINRPSTIAPYLLANWDKYCLTKISNAVPSPLTDEIRRAITEYDFTRVELWKASELVERPHMRAVLLDHIDIDPGQPPTLSDEDVPAETGHFEAAYVSQLIRVFSEHRQADFADFAEVAADPEYGPEMLIARRRYLEHRHFSLHYRDNFFDRHVQQVDKDVHDRVVDQYRAMRGGPKYDRLLKLMLEASGAIVSGPFGKHNRVSSSVKQGACHHFANIGKMPW